MKYINEEHLGPVATETDARRMVELLTARGYNVEYTPCRGSSSGDGEDAFPDDVWFECLALID